MEIPIRENGRVRWVKCSKSIIDLLTSEVKRTNLPISSTEEFDKWYNLYSKKTTKKLAVAYWKKHITEDLIPKIMKHTKSYVDKTEKCYRLDPIRYLKYEKYNDALKAMGYEGGIEGYIERLSDDEIREMGKTSSGFPLNIKDIENWFI